MSQNRFNSDEDWDSMCQIISDLESSLGIDWNSPSTSIVRPYVSIALTARLNQIRAAIDCKRWSEAEKFVNALFASDIPWDRADPATISASMRLLSLLPNNYVECHEHSNGAQKLAGDTQSCCTPAIDIWTRGIGLAEQLLEISCGQDNGSDYENTSYYFEQFIRWMTFAAHRDNSDLLKRELMNYARGNHLEVRSRSEMPHTLPYAIYSLLENNSSDQVGMAADVEWHATRRIFYDLVDSGDVNPRVEYWTANLITALAVLARSLAGETESYCDIYKLIKSIHSKWPDWLRIEKNTAVAIYKLLQMFVGASEQSRGSSSPGKLSDDQQEFMVEVFIESQWIGVPAVTGDTVIAEQFFDLLSDDNKSKLVVSFLDLHRKEPANERAMYLLEFAARVCLAANDRVKQLAWDAVLHADLVQQLAWLSVQPPLIRAGSFSHLHDRQARFAIEYAKRRYGNFDETVQDAWVSLIVHIAASAASRGDQLLVEYLLRELPVEDERFIESWFLVLGCAVIGSSAEYVQENAYDWIQEVNECLSLAPPSLSVARAVERALLALSVKIRDSHPEAASECLQMAEACVSKLVKLNQEEKLKMNPKELDAIDKYLADSIFEHWRDGTSRDDLTSGLAAFDQLQIIAKRQRSAAANAVVALVEELKEVNEFTIHPRREDIVSFATELERRTTYVPTIKKQTLDGIRVDLTSDVESEFGDGYWARLIQPAEVIRAGVVAAPWSSFDQPDLVTLIESLSPIDNQLKLEQEDSYAAWVCLPFYEDVFLVRMTSRAWSDNFIVAYYLIDNDRTIYRLDGTSPVIHEVNSNRSLLINERTVADYLRFFCFFVRGDEGPFYILESINDELLPKNENRTVEAVLKAAAAPIKLVGTSDDGSLLCDAVVFYSNAVFRANFKVFRTGMVEMLDDDPVAADLPVRVEYPISIRHL